VREQEKATPVELRVAALKEAFPEAFRDGALDLPVIATLVGATSNKTEERERFGLNWPGKAEAAHTLRLPALGTLKPDRAHSLNFDTAGHTFITGENLEVMKLLQKAYFGAFKMIYMDPPYNTGADLIYNDDYRDPLLSYLRYSGQLTTDDRRVTSLLETDGRFHSRWLSMMLPRLFVARNLLAANGVIFVSIDDHESHHLRLLMDEVFGSENFVCSFIWEKRYAPPPDVKDIGYVHENILCYRRSDEFHAALLPMTTEQKGRYKASDGDSRGAWKSADYTCRYTAKERPTLFYPIRKRSSGFEEIQIEAKFEGRLLHIDVTHSSPPFRDLTLEVVKPNGKTAQIALSIKKRAEEFDLNIDGSPRAISVSPRGPILVQWPKSTRVWACSQAEHKRNEAEDLISWPADAKVPAKKRFISKIRQGAMPTSLLRHSEVGHTDEATKELRKWFPDLKVTPKPTRLIRHLMRIAGIRQGDLVLDCFAGTGTTAEAVLDANDQDAIGATFVLIQLPEPLKDRARQTMSDIARERAVRRIKAKRTNKLIGLRCFYLTSSCFHGQPSDVPKDKKGFAEQLRRYVDNVVKESSGEEILYEVLIKAGFPLTSTVERIKLGKQTAYSVDGGALLVCLERKISLASLRGMIGEKPERIICLDLAFDGNDKLKTNAVLEMRGHSIEFRTI
jgi:adenine-specific DNA-methyltransferase